MKKIPGVTSAARMMCIWALGVSLAMAQQPAGTIRAWGANGGGQLGDGLSGSSVIPDSVVSLTGVIAVAGGTSHSLVLNPMVRFGPGERNFGQWGAGNILQSAVPVAVTGFGADSSVQGSCVTPAPGTTGSDMQSWDAQQRGLPTNNPHEPDEISTKGRK